MGQGGVKDLKRHGRTALHTRAEKSAVGMIPLGSYFGPVRRERTLKLKLSLVFSRRAPSCFIAR